MNKVNTIRDWALNKVGCPYIFASHGEKCTPQWRQHQVQSKPAYAVNIKKYCPVLSGKKGDCGGCAYQDKAAYDCSGLTKEAGRLAGISLPHGATSQWKGNWWAQKGSIENLPSNMLAFVFNQEESSETMSHVGIYLGDGYVVDARGHAQGVMHKPLESYPWDHYGILIGLTEEEVTNTETFALGSKGPAVASLQKRLNNAGYDCGAADGIFGKKTESAVKNLQAALGQMANGIADEKVQAALAEKDSPGDAKALAQAVYEAIKNYL